MVALAERTARALGCSEGEVQDIRWGARLHDIGKIGVPDAILSKPSGLTEQEWTTTP
jgi:HD-GYP domain-containing protein (c-di-GMP phosphodiesterase class II)